MKTVFTFSLSLIAASAFLTLLGWLVSSRMPRLRHWPAFWAVLSVAGLAIPVLSLLGERLSALMPSGFYRVYLPFMRQWMPLNGWFMSQ